MTSLLAAALSSSEPLWRSIEQPLALRLAVAAAGLALIAAELWWFLGRHGTAALATAAAGGWQEVTITVDGGYVPARVRLQAGRPVRLTFHRLDPSSCVARVIVPDFQRSLDLPLNARTSLELPPLEPGIYPFHCGMAMVRGVLEVVPDQSRAMRSRERGVAVSDGPSDGLS
ncbi:cupredoxin domain-containing protein [Cyanobium sp. NIES-981]|uniref:cupredoxin domain-containing protein n=1 Tax=Cyanobium sp. NIES-981 TaxID=1851505 RepID=UPI0007DDD415|nr:cupredoxin domain-containing protein [Cyanobium sp. NIES-981]SBO42077.1 Copper-transporting ATPase [Cyanobium sp. NIES-981]